MLYNAIRFEDEGCRGTPQGGSATVVAKRGLQGGCDWRWRIRARRSIVRESGRRVGLARLTRRGRANTWMCERPGPSENRRRVSAGKTRDNRFARPYSRNYK